jgi:16S rRNA (cytosine967-C5)-methyltransferase
MKPASARHAALQALRSTILQGQFLDASLDSALSKIDDVRERSLARELAYGVCRFWFRLTGWRDSLLQHPLKDKDLDVGILINLGLYQLEYSRIPVHAAVAETVQLATSSLRKRWANALVNAVLRRFIREKEQCLNDGDSQPAQRLAHPQWLVDALREAWPDGWQDILTANNTHASMTLRVNTRLSSRALAIEHLASHAISATPSKWSSEGIVLDEPRDVGALPGFSDGMFSVQDQAAQLAAELLDVSPGHRFVDACAAPGGKFAHILESTPQIGYALALDRDAARSKRIEQTLQRLGLNGHVVTADARNIAQWWDGKPFDRILIDAPCSAIGVIRRHPDIKLHRDAADLTTLARDQYALLHALWPLLADNGRLLYATCSVMPAENSEPINRFLRAHCDARSISLDVDWGIAASPGRQILPGEDGMDGFYYALLAKT